MAQAKNSLVASGSNGKNPPLSVALASNGMQRMIGASFNGDKRAMTKFTSNLMSVYTANPLLKDCTPVSIVSAGLQCAALNLSTSPSLGEAWIIPYGDKATFQIGKNGLVQLAIRSGRLFAVTHPGEYIPVDLLRVARAAEECGVYVEINNKHPMKKEDLCAALQTNAKFILSSDAHAPERVGRVERAYEAAMEAGVPRERIVNLLQEG